MTEFAPKPPSRLLMAAELPRLAWTLGQFALAWRALGQGAAGDGRPIMLLPGVFTSDISNRALELFLKRRGYRATGWKLGRNMGLSTIGLDGERLIARVESVAAERGERVTLIGVSLGGVMARYVARRRPDLVRGVITIASPFAGSMRATNVWRAYEAITHESIDAPGAKAMLEEAALPLSVPTTAIWSPSDGLVAGELCRAPEGHVCHNIEINAAHIASPRDPRVLRAVTEALEAQ